MADDKHENPVESMIHDLKSIAGFKTYVITNNQGIVLKYEGVEVRKYEVLTYRSCH